jgi:FkbH-like protein
MIQDLFVELAWLPRRPDDFAAQCRTAATAEGDLGDTVRKLATYALDAIALGRLTKVIDRVRADGRSLAPLTPFKLGILGNGTIDFIVPAFVASAARHGIALECFKSDYDQIIQEALNPDSRINRARPDAVLIALDYRGLPLRFIPGDAAGTTAGVEGALDYLASIREALRENGCPISIVQTLAPPAEGLFGSLDRLVPGTARRVIEQFNIGLAGSLQGAHNVLFDVAALAETVGLANWHSPAWWNLAKLPFADEYVPVYADHLARLLGAIRGKSRRALVLDLDNTVWGGIIGDDGMDGIRVSQGDAVGEAHLTVQRMALALRERGIVLAVSSKNIDEVARQPFREHPEMLLKEDHIAVFQANWDDKATNIRAIADELSLGLDAIVFLDDNPAERGLIRQVLPQVAVPELPDDPALYARTLAAAGYFESVAYSDEDRKRAVFYQNNARRVSLQKKVGDLQAYLTSLNMEITFRPFDAVGRARITQLINKSNQFNLTTRRYTEADVADAERDPNVFTLQVRLTDAFGDNGMISVILCRPRDGHTWEIDTWLMSCRVLGRQVESMVLREILHHARARDIHRLIGTYRPTERNSLVRDHYSKLGFQLVDTANGATTWQLDTATEVPSAPMKTRRLHFDLVDG